ncbi:MAG: hypothetical protein AAGG75_11195 [Bacteroidota bacterium]
MKMYSKIFALLFLLSFSIGCDKDDDDSVGCSITQLENTSWRVTLYEENDSFAEPPGTYVLEVNSTSFTLSLDVNNCGGNLQICDDDQLINFTEAGCTEACCDSDFAESMVDFLVNDVITFEVDNDQLKLLSSTLLDKRLTLVRS